MYGGAAMLPDYRYLARVLRVIDADTLYVDLDLGCDIHARMTLRRARINAPEMSTDAGKSATEYVRALLPPGTVVVVETIKDKREKYGRYLAVIHHSADGPPLNTVLVDLGYAVPSSG
jgi:micrococcal nuclease